MLVGGTGVAVGDSGVLVGGTGVAVGGTGVSVASCAKTVFDQDTISTNVNTKTIAVTYLLIIFLLLIDVNKLQQTILLVKKTL